MTEFTPTKTQQKYKAVFWTNVDKNPMMGDVAELPVAEICRLAGTPTVIKWAEVDGFKEWWLDKDGIEAKIAFGAELAVDRMIDVLNTEPDAGKEAVVTTKDQIAVAKMMLEFAGRKPATKTEHIVKPGELPDTEDGLRKYIAAQAKKLRVIDAT